MHLMLSKTVLWQLSLRAIRMFCPQLKLGEINWIPGDSFVFGGHIWGIYVASVPFGVKVLQHQSSSDGIWPFGGRLCDYCRDSGKWNTRHGVRGRQGARGGVGSLRACATLQNPGTVLWCLTWCYRVQRWRRSWGKEVWNRVTVVLAKTCSWEGLSWWPFELAALLGC